MHEAYLRLIDSPPGQNWKSRGHFLGAAAEVMRRFLVEQARRERSQKGGRRIATVSGPPLRFELLHPLKVELVKLHIYLWPNQYPSRRGPWRF